MADSERGAMGAIGRGVESAQNQPMVGFVSGRACGSGCKRRKEDAIRRRRSRWANKIRFEENGKDWIGCSKLKNESIPLAAPAEFGDLT